MKTQVLHLLITLFTLSSLPITVVSQQLKNDSMKNIRFIPEEFNKIELGDSSTRSNPCTPSFPDDEIPINSVTINTPKKIIYNIDVDTIYPIIPVCIIIDVTSRRVFKYDDKPMTFHMKMEAQNEVYSGEYFKEEIIYEGITFGWANELVIKEHNRKVAEAKKYSDDELDEGQELFQFMNSNIMNYVKMPFLPGKYEVWCTFRGLTSNLCHFEIIAKKFEE